MRDSIRVAHIDELVPGKGVTLQIGARSVTVYNVEGTLHAHVTETHATGPTEWPLTRHATCSAPPGHGHSFFTSTEDSPARLDGWDRHLVPRVDGEWVVLVVDDEA